MQPQNLVVAISVLVMSTNALLNVIPELESRGMCLGRYYEVGAGRDPSYKN